MRPRVLAALIGLLPPAVTGLSLWWLLATGGWSAWGVETMKAKVGWTTSFADLVYPTSTSDCIMAGSDITMCDPYGRPFQPYLVPPARVFAFFGLGSEATGMLGVGLAAVYVLTVLMLSMALVRHWPRGLPSLLVAAGILTVSAVSPPPMLMIERGQLEVVVLALAAFALLTLGSSRGAWRSAGALAAVAAVITKFFPVGLFLPFLRRGTRHWWALGAFAVSLLWLAVMLTEVLDATRSSRAGFPMTTRASFGSGVLFTTWQSDMPIGYVPSIPVGLHWGQFRLLGAALLLAVVLLGVAWILLSSRALRVRELDWNLVVGSTGILALPYLLGASHDYRLVFLLPALVGTLLWTARSAGRERILPLLLCAASVLALVTGAAMLQTPWGFSWPKPWLLAGDLALLTVLGLSLALWVVGAVIRPVTVTR